MPSYTIGQLARSVNVPTSTIRFYERTGLFKPDTRSSGNYRQYTPASLDRLRFIRSAQATGFSLDDIRELLSLTHSDNPPCDDVVALTNKRLAEVRDRIRELRAVEKVLSHSLQTCCKGVDEDLCDQLTRLGGKQCRPADKARFSRKCPPAKKVRATP